MFMPEYVLNKLQGVQNTLARVVTRSDARTPTAPLLYETLLVADPPKNLVQTANADLQSPICFYNTIRVRPMFLEVLATRYGQLTVHCCPCREQKHQLQDGVSLAMCRRNNVADSVVNCDTVWF